MARSERYDQSVSEEDYDEVREGIDQHFETVYRLLADELGGEPEDYELDTDELDAWATNE